MISFELHRNCSHMTKLRGNPPTSIPAIWMIAAMLSVLALLPSYTLPPPGCVRASASRAAVQMFEPDPNDFAVRPAITRSRQITEREGGRVVVSDGSSSLYGSRDLLQMLYDHGDHRAIVAHSASASATKKLLTTRSARYSGLSGVLQYSEGELCAEGAVGGTDAVGAADAWLAINADEAALPAQLSAAKAAGVRRVFLLITDDGTPPRPSEFTALEEQLKQAGMVYTVMRTGALVDDGASGGGLAVGVAEQPICGGVSKEDVFRFVTEALTLPEASGKVFSLCPSEGAALSSLREMRMRGCSRRDEVRAVMRGFAEEGAALGAAPPAAALASAPAAVVYAEDTFQVAAPAELVAAEAEAAAAAAAEAARERESELRMLIQRARQRGAVVTAELKLKEETALKRRAEQAKYYSAPPNGGAEDAPPAAPDASSPPPEA